MQAMKATRILHETKHHPVNVFTVPLSCSSYTDSVALDTLITCAPLSFDHLRGVIEDERSSTTANSKLHLTPYTHMDPHVKYTNLEGKEFFFPLKDCKSWLVRLLTTFCDTFGSDASRAFSISCQILLYIQY